MPVRPRISWSSTSPDPLWKVARLLLVLAGLSLVHPGFAQSTSPTLPLKGPLPTRNYEPLNTPFLLPSSADPNVLGRARTRWDLNLDIVNNLLTVQEPGNQMYNTDFEEQRLYIGYARGLGRGQEVSVRVPFVARNGGFLDSFINVWHSLFGLKGGGRGDLPEYKVRYEVNDDRGQSIVNSTKGAGGLGDVVLEYRKELTTVPLDDTASLRRVTASARGLIKLPTGSTGDLLGSGAMDVGAGVLLSARPNRRFALHGNLTLVLLGDSRINNLSHRRTLIHSLLAAEYLFDGRTSLVAQTDDNSAPFTSGISYSDRPRRGFTAGLWRQINTENRLYLSIGENDFGPLAKHAPDFTLSLGLRRIQ